MLYDVPWALLYAPAGTLVVDDRAGAPPAWAGDAALPNDGVGLDAPPS